MPLPPPRLTPWISAILAARAAGLARELAQCLRARRAAAKDPALAAQYLAAEMLALGPAEDRVARERFLSVGVSPVRASAALRSIGAILRNGYLWTFPARLDTEGPNEKQMVDDANDRPSLAPNQVARMLAISESTLRRLVKRGEFPAPVKAGKIVRWYRGDVIAWLRGGIVIQGPSAMAGGQICQVR